MIVDGQPVPRKQPWHCLIGIIVKIKEIRIGDTARYPPKGRGCAINTTMPRYREKAKQSTRSSVHDNNEQCPSPRGRDRLE